MKITRGPVRFFQNLMLTLAAAAAPVPLNASETVTYTYDELGRLVQVGRAGAVNNGVTESYSYDPANNRTNVTVTGVASPPSFAINDVAVNESGNLVFTVTKTGTTATSYSVNYAIAAGTATLGSDFDYSAQAQTGTLGFASNVTSQTVTVHTIDDAAIESPETVLVNLSGATGGASITDAQGVGTINDDDGTPACSGVTFTVSSNGPVQEGGTSAFSVIKSGTATGSCTVNYATGNGTAVAPGDYTAVSGTLSFAATQSSIPVNVTTVTDAAIENFETFTLSLSSPGGGAALGTPASATATINDSGNQAPHALDDTGSQQKCSTGIYNVIANDTDPEGNYPLVVTGVTGIGFSVSSPAEIQFMSTQGTGAKVGTYTVRDSLNATSTATLTVTVSGGVCQ